MGRTAVVMAMAMAGCGLAVLATASCAMPPAPPMSPGALPKAAPVPTSAPSLKPPLSPSPPSPSASPSSPSASASPSSPAPPSGSGPAVPVGDGVVTAADQPLLAAARQEAGAAVPGDDAVIVINRGPSGTGQLAWMPDERSYCLAVVREARARTSCKALPASWARIGVRLVTTGGTTAARTVFFAVVDGGHGPYGYQGRAGAAPGPDMGPVHDATAVFASGRTLSLLTYERTVGVLTPGDHDICSADNAICFPALDAYAG
ncbi:hypothetical protein NRK68_16330 [Streptomyces yangpuensis]|uniref:Lipoprotein n=1 Tax=Streptomyces yangpuensis TaxID=1648182 RepID=A0ABY5PXG1_9ACTN|nr:hypothetical protein [Streptomyces yangpuensis]UUY48625.1 hypothetical protein NRK68_16330 [Streptomyces yangpuensis]